MAPIAKTSSDLSSALHNGVKANGNHSEYNKLFILLDFRIIFNTTSVLMNSNQ